ncbi:unnamed protein product [Ranitomeya imitator]|uniref:Nucleoside-diphosphate kinase n=1 Tax=Ranitomeya imitator TaxID=111125 RepID=A0ABN9MA85_9NEOB|nr:unnamed protein product [Ranitomeya imitator]
MLRLGKLQYSSVMIHPETDAETGKAAGKLENSSVMMIQPETDAETGKAGVQLSSGPASGKGTQCEKLSQKYNLTYLSIADLLQSDLAAASERSKLIKDLMQHGNPVSIEIILEILKDAVSSSLGSTKGFVLGAFPCEVRQAEELECKLCAPNLVLYLDCSAEIMTTRVVGRSKVSHRNEVATENVKRRLQMFYQAMEPLLTYYKTKGLLCKINAERSPEQVFLQVCTAVDAIF